MKTLEQIKAAIANNKKLIEENEALRARNAELTGALEATTQALAEANEDQGALLTRAEEAEGQVQALEEAAQEAEAQALEITAELGVAAGAEPQCAELATKSVEELQKELEAEKDPVKAAAICRELRELQWGQK